MRSPGCASAALRHVLRLCRERRVPTSEVLIVCSSTSEAKLLEHLVDVTLPMSTHELLCVGPAGLASSVLGMSPRTAAASRWGGPFATRSLLQNSIHALPLSPTLRPPNDPLRHVDPLLAAFDLLQFHDADPDLLEAAGRQGGPAAADLAAAYAPWLRLKELARLRDPSDVVQLALRDAAGVGAGLAQGRWSEVVLPDAHNLGLPGLTLLWRLFGQRAAGAAPRRLAVTAFASPHLEQQPGGRVTALLRRAAAVAGGAPAPSSGPGSREEPFSWEVCEVVGSDAGRGASDAAPPPSPLLVSGGGSALLAALRARGCAEVQAVQSESLVLEPGARPRAVSCVAVDPRADRIPVLAAIVEEQMARRQAQPAAGAGRPLPRRRRTVGILCPSASQAADLATGLRDAAALRGWGLAAEVVCDGARRLGDLPGVRAVVAALSAAVAPAADVRPLFALGAGAPYSIPEGDLAGLLRGGPGAADAPPASAARLEALRAHLADARRAYGRSGSVAAYAAAFLRRSGLGAALSAAAGPDAEADAAAVEELLGLLQQLEQGAALAVAGGGGSSASRRRWGGGGAGQPLLPLSEPDSGAAPPGAPGAFVPDAAGAYSIDAAAVPGALPLVLSQLLDLLGSLRVHLSHEDSVAALCVDDAAAPGDERDGAVAEAAAAVDAEPARSTVADLLEAAAVAEVRAAAVAASPGAEAAPEAEEAEEAEGGEGGSAAGPPPLTVVVTTLRRGPAHQFDAVVFPWLVDSALPGALRLPPVAPPEALLQPPPELLDGCPAPAGLPRTRDEHVAAQRQRLRTAMSAAREDVVIVAPGDAGASPLRHRRRSRFIDELFGGSGSEAPVVPPPRTRRRAAPAPSLVDAAAAAPFASPTASSAGAAAAAVASLTAAPAAAAAAPTASAGAGSGEAQSHAAAPPEQPLLPLSFSRLFELQSCPRRFFLGRSLRLQQVGSAGQHYGSGMHAAVASFSIALRDVILRCCATVPDADASRAAAGGSSVSSGTLGLLETGAAAAARLLRDPALRAAVRAELPTPEAATGSMLAEYHASWAGAAEAGARSSTAPSELAALTERSLDPPLPISVPAAQRRELDRCAHEGLAAFAGRELGAAHAFLRDPAAAAGGWLGVPSLVEHPFAVDLPEIGVRLRGVIDRVDVACGGGGTAGAGGAASSAGGPSFVATVREFKSSVQWAAADALSKRARSSLQLQTYAVALHAACEPAAPAPGAQEPGAEAPPAPIDFGAGLSLVLESIETGERAALRQPGGAADALGRARAAATAELAAAAGVVRGGEFPATPSLFACGMCPFSAVCTSRHAWA